MRQDEKDYILANFPAKSPGEIARGLGIRESKVRKFIEKNKNKINRDKGFLKTLREIRLPVAGSVIILIIMSVAVYVNIIGGQFLLDDDLLIKDNTYVKSWVHIPRLFTVDMGEGIGIQSNYYRPLQMLTYMVEYHFWKLNEKPYHITNILLHTLVVLAVYWMVNILFKNNFLALATALLHAVHPIQPESVAYISGRGDCMVALFTVLSFILYIKQLNARGFGVYISLFLCYITALFSKENSLVLPGIFLLYHFTFRKRIKIYPFVLLCLTSFLYLFFRLTLMKEGSTDMSAVGILQRVPGFFVAITGYMKMLVFPFGLYMGHETKLFSMLNPQAVLGALITVFLVVSAVLFHKKQRLYFFSVMWFFMTLMPVSNLYPVAFFMADHYLYIPAIGFFLIAAQGLRYMRDRLEGRMRMVPYGILAAVVVFFSVLTIYQNKYWSNAKYFYERTLKYQPYSPRMYSNLAKEYVLRDKPFEAIKYYKKAIEINPAFVNAHYNLGVTYNMIGEKQKAIESCMRAIRFDPSFTHAYNILGVVYWSMGEKEKAIDAYNKAVMTSPSNVIAMSNLAAVLYQTGDKGRAKELLERAIRANPDYSPSYANLGFMYSEDGKHEKAIPYYIRALELNPQDANTYNNLGKSYFETGDLQRAEKSFERALQIDPGHANAANNLKVIRYRLQQGR